jgi:pimeloyl-ACP methyl ester carboxylesterase
MMRPATYLTRVKLPQYATVSGSYKLAATYCEPDSGPGHILQILTHGVGFDRSYWDFPFSNYDYSYVNRALDAGHSTLTWDRLGIGHSSHGDPINEIQIFLEISALKALTDIARDGHLCGVSHKFDKTVHVGHSFGSAMTYGLTAMYPNITHGIILTGFSHVAQFMAYFALGANFAPVSDNDMLAKTYTVGYIAPKDSIGVHINFFGPGDFDPELLKVATMTGQPAAVGELLTVGSGPKSSDFAGPVMVITGSK